MASTTTASEQSDHTYQLVLGQSVTGAWAGDISDARAASVRGELHLVRYETKPKSADVSQGIMTVLGEKDVFVSTKRSQEFDSSGAAHFKGQHETLAPKAGEFLLVVDRARKIVRLERLSTRSNVRHNRAPSKTDVTHDPYTDSTHAQLEAKYSSDAPHTHSIPSLLTAPTGSRVSRGGGGLGAASSASISSSPSAQAYSTSATPIPPRMAYISPSPSTESLSTNSSQATIATSSLSHPAPPPSIEVRRSSALFDSSDSSDDDDDDFSD